MKDKEFNLMKFLSEAKILQNGQEGSNTSPLESIIKSEMDGLSNLVDLKNSNNEELIKTNLTYLNEFMTNEDNIKSSPKLMENLSDTIKTLLDLPRISIGLPDADNTLNKVLKENPDLTKSLYTHVLKNNLRVDHNGKNVCDLNVLSSLFLSKLEYLTGDKESENLLITSDIFKDLMEDKDIKEMINPKTLENASEKEDLDNVINGFKNIEMIMLKTPHLIIPDIFEFIKSNKNVDEDFVEIIKQKLDLILDISEEQRQKLTEQEKIDLDKAEEKLADRIKDYDLNFTDSSSLDAKLNKYKEEQSATAYLKAKEDLELEDKIKDTLKIESIKRNNDLHKIKYNLKTTTYLQNVNNKGSGGLLEFGSYQIAKYDKYNNFQGNVCSVGKISGVVTFKVIDQQPILQAGIYHLMENTKLKEGETFQLYLNFNGDRSIGCSYIENTINAALNMNPPVDIDNIHVQKEYRPILDNIKASLSFKASSAPILDSKNIDGLENTLEEKNIDNIKNERSIEEEKPVEENSSNDYIQDKPTSNKNPFDEDVKDDKEELLNEISELKEENNKQKQSNDKPELSNDDSDLAFYENLGSHLNNVNNDVEEVNKRKVIKNPRKKI